MAIENLIEKERQAFIQRMAHERANAPTLIEEMQTDDLRFLNGTLQRKWTIRTHTGMDTVEIHDEWRNIPSVTE